MLKKNVAKLEIMLQDFLQYRYKIYCAMGRRDADWTYYEGVCDTITACGGTWTRSYKGGESEEEKSNPNNYSHTVWLPDDEICKRLNENCWKD